VDNPELLPGEAPVLSEPAGEQNPMYIPLGATFETYRQVFDAALSALNDFGFDVKEANFYDGRIETLPRIAPGLLRPLRPGNTGAYERLLATFQTYRHRVQVLIQPAHNGGYWIRVIAYKELEDLPRPTRSTAGAAIFRTDNNVERQYEVIDPTVFESNWIPRGQDPQVEQQLLVWIRKCLLPSGPVPLVGPP
jgi:hypothetical protein